MKNDSYGDHIKRIMKLLRIVSNVILHLGWKLGTKIMEFFEAEDSEIKKLGNWNPGIVDTHYSAKLPLCPIRTMAGYPNETRFYVNHRSSVEPPEGLLKLTPLGRWVYRAREEAFAADTDNKHQTCHHVLSFFCELNKVFLQDSAALLCFFSERANHPMFQELLVFQHPDFLVSCVACASVVSSLSCLLTGILIVRFTGTA